MLSRIAIAIFYAVVFFALGAWTGGRMPGLRDTLNRGAQSVSNGAHRLQTWAQGTISTGDSNATTETADDSNKPNAAEDQPLAAARKAFARGNVSEAVAAYQEAVKQKPDDADAWGELGNVYYSSGRLPEASRAFYEAATRMLDKGDAAKAKALLPAIRSSAPALADEIERRLAQTVAPATSPAQPAKSI